MTNKSQRDIAAGAISGLAGVGGHSLVASHTPSTGGATVEDVSLMSRIVRDKGLGVKASGGVRSLADLMKMVNAGATRIGTSNGVKIVKESRGEATGEGAKY